MERILQSGLTVNSETRDEGKAPQMRYTRPQFSQPDHMVPLVAVSAGLRGNAS